LLGLVPLPVDGKAGRHERGRHLAGDILRDVLTGL
jgi:hypothetical protein